MTTSPEYRCRLVVMVKEPRPGRVKTRLGRDIGMVPAVWWFRHQTRRLLRRIQSPAWQTIIAVSPDREGLQSKIWPTHLHRWPQGRGDLGQRMARIFDQMPCGPVVIVGADIPDLTRTHVAHAFHALGSHEAVFGPSEDGGYWLVGLKRVSPRPGKLFKDVRWSTEYALADSLSTLPGHSIAMLDVLRDVDDISDL